MDMGHRSDTKKIQHLATANEGLAVAEAHSPISQFDIHDIVPMHLGGVDVSFTNSAAWMMVAVVASCGLLLAASRPAALIPGRLQAFGEMLYSFVANMIRENAGAHGKDYFPFIFTIFMVVLMGNLLGMIPFSFTYTSHIIVTGILAVSVFLVVTVIGFVKHGTHFLSLFSPPGVPLPLKFLIIPIEVLSYLIRPVTLSVRLFANMMAGHLVLKVFAGFCVSLGLIFGLVPMMFNVVLIGFELLVASLQAYIFAVLSCIYLKDALDLH